MRVDVERTTIDGMLETGSKANGKPSVFVQTAALQDFDVVCPTWGREMGATIQFWEVAGMVVGLAKTEFGRE